MLTMIPRLLNSVNPADDSGDDLPPAIAGVGAPPTDAFGGIIADATRALRQFARTLEVRSNAEFVILLKAVSDLRASELLGDIRGSEITRSVEIRFVETRRDGGGEGGK